MTPRTVLVVDDDGPVRSVLKVLVSRLGYTALAAQDGKEALQIYREHVDEIGLVISDVFMLEITGLDLLDALLEINPLVKVLLISGIPPLQLSPTPQFKKAFGFAKKPFDLEELRKAIKRALGD